jgi:hypothetical protein
MTNVLDCVQVRLVDFNPIGGSTSPLLFDWEELRYGVSVAQPDQAASQQGGVDGLPGAEDPSAAHGQASEETAGCEGPSHRAAQGRSTNGSRASAERGPGEPPCGGSGNGHAAGDTEILFRLAPAEGRLRPGAAAYGAPFDMADLSEGGAIAEMLKKLQVEVQDD